MSILKKIAVVSLAAMAAAKLDLRSIVAKKAKALKGGADAANDDVETSAPTKHAKPARSRRKPAARVKRTAGHEQQS